jgi:hypothetical protein
MPVLPWLLNVSACGASGVVSVRRGEDGLVPVFLSHPGAGRDLLRPFIDGSLSARLGYRPEPRPA